jgi:L-ribulokinase
MGKKYVLGIDYGSLSGRALLADTDGTELAVSVFDYPHAVMDEFLLGSTKRLPPNYALQHPQDYIDVLSHTIPDVLKKAGISADDVIGVGIDFTACTILPVFADGTPLCFADEFKSNPHAYVKLWKHHAAQDKANRLNEAAEKRGETWLKRYGGKISSEWEIPKIWQILDEAPEVYAKADKIIEAADYIIWLLTGIATRNTCTAGYKGIWSKREGHPSKEFFASLDPRLANVVEEKFIQNIMPVGVKAGEISSAASMLTGLKAGTAVAVGNVDAHVSIPAVKIGKSGQMLAIMGTSTCHIMLGDNEKAVPGMCGVVEDGVLPGFFGYEAGQSCVGDHFAWFVDNCVPASYTIEAKSQGVNIHKFLRRKAETLRTGESGLVALDWWNGNRSVLVDADLTGLIIGMTLLTKPEDIYRALIEATAYGTRMIIDTFNQNGVPVTDFVACGGIAEKDEFTMQIYADVIKMPIKIAGSSQAPALGSAIFGAVAAGSARGGFDSISSASEAMGKLMDKIYTPIAENSAIYDKLFAEYKLLHDTFGRGENDVMKRLINLKKSVMQCGSANT